MTSALTANSWVSSWPARSPLLLSSLSHVHISATQSPILSTGEEARRLKLGRLRRTLLATTYLHTSKCALPSEERQVGRQVCNYHHLSSVAWQVRTAKASLVVDIACLAEALVELDDGAKVVEASRMQMGVEREWERAGRGRQMFMPPNG